MTAEQMDRCRGDFDNWAVTDDVCFKLFDQVPGACAKADAAPARRGVAKPSDP